MNINDLDLNLLRLFDAVYRSRNVSRAAQLVGLSQPAASQGLTRLRLLIKDPLFVRAPGGVQPTPRADRLAQSVQMAIAAIEAALNEEEQFDPARSRRTIRLHLSDIGEARFLPPLMAALGEHAPHMQVQTVPISHTEISQALDSGAIDFAIGFLPSIHDTQHIELLSDRYIILLRNDHPFMARRRTASINQKELLQLEYVAVRSHPETLRILQLLRLEDRLRLTTSHFLALPGIVKQTNLGAIMPLETAQGFMAAQDYTIIEPRLPLRDFTVSLHWSHRSQSDPAHRWLYALLIQLFKKRE